ncbi:hypothetical protein BT63DRAFT_441862 [Microthyrium microscopicum]|uniref:DUF7514 domain-containing protein n=1 Tax=Microthyrium microscopicum TaxID=703497 RepID=A0A6A6U3G5_9PEZI|nr:hypothetical protein BT63DRAFT_441862 [Microthyrium microscopicum]
MATFGGPPSFQPSQSDPRHYTNMPPSQERANFDGSPARFNGYPPPPPPSGQPEYPSSFNGYPPPSGPPASQPIADAVNNAFDTSAAANQLPSDVIAQITAHVRSQVIDSLKQELAGGQTPFSGTPGQQTPFAPGGTPAVNIPMPGSRPPVASPSHNFGPGGAPPPVPNFPPPGDQPYVVSPGQSNSTWSQRNSTRTIRTPPTPERDSDESAYFNNEDTREKSSYSQNIREDTSKPIPIRRPSNKSPSRGGNMKEDLTSRYGERTREGSTTTEDRPAANRSRTNDDETVVEKMWQPLFDAECMPTARMNQFLRGVALYLVEDYEPKNSLVVGPRKMKKFFEAMKISNEVFPWKDIFSLPSPQLSALYTSLSSQHHLIPRSSAPFEAPHLAALTSQGFASFMTVFIQAYPDLEFQRLAATVRELPISNADERKERWPKELSRRLLPRTGSETQRRKLNDVLRKVGVAGPNTSLPPPPPGHPPASAPPQGYSSSAPQSGFAPPPNPSSQNPKVTFSTQHRPSQTPQPSNLRENHGETSDSDDSSRPSIPIERERKPYIAKEGGGKIHEEKNSRPSQSVPPPSTTSNRPPERGSTSSKYPPTAAPPRRERAPSNADRNSYPTGKRSSTVRPHSPADRQYGRNSGPLDNSGSNGSTGYYEDERERYYEQRSERERGDRERSDRDRGDRERNDRDRLERGERERSDRSRADRDRLERGERADRANSMAEGLDRVSSRPDRDDTRGERVDRVQSGREEDERERRYAKYDEEYRRNGGSLPGVSSGSYAGNAPLGTGERRY